MDTVPSPPALTSDVPSIKPSLDAKTIQVITLLVWFYPLGVVLMWLWMKDWPKGLKWSVTLPIVFGIVAFLISLPLGAYLSAQLTSSVPQQRPSELLREYEDLTNP